MTSFNQGGPQLPPDPAARARVGKQPQVLQDLIDILKGNFLSECAHCRGRSSDRNYLKPCSHCGGTGLMNPKS